MEDQFYDRNQIELSIIICTHNRYNTLPASVRSIEMQSLEKNRFELIVVDNSADSAERTSFLDAFQTNCNCIYSIEEKAGLSRARNRGVDLASGEFVCFLDDDAIADEDWAAKIVACFRDTPSVGVLGGPVKPIWPTERPAWLHEWQEGFLTIVDRGGEARALAPGEWLAGTNIAFRTELVRTLGGFDEKLGRTGSLLLSNEEVRLCERIAEDGHELWYFPDVSVLHRVHADRISQAWLRKRVAFQVVSELLDQDIEAFDPKGAVDTILDFADSMPRRSRALHGLFADVEDPDGFNKQTNAIAALMRLCLLDGADWLDHLETRDVR